MGMSKKTISLNRCQQKFGMLSTAFPDMLNLTIKVSWSVHQIRLHLDCSILLEVILYQKDLRVFGADKPGDVVLAGFGNSGRRPGFQLLELND